MCDNKESNNQKHNEQSVADAHQTDSGITRAQFLRGSGFGIAGLAALGIMGGCSSSTVGKNEDSNPKTPEVPVMEIGLETVLSLSDKSYEADVVIAGSGAAGMAAAVEAASQGVSVILVEAGGTLGGSTAFAEGLLGLNTKYQRARGISNDVEEAVAAELVGSAYLANIYLLRGFLRSADENIEWLEEHGVTFLPEPNTINPLNTYQHFYDGRGKTAIAALAKNAESMGADLRLNTRVKRVILEEGALQGVTVESDDGEYLIATKALILATGGFLQNPELFDEKFPYPSRRIMNIGAPHHYGDGYLIAKAAGGDQHGVCSPGWVWAGLKSFDIHSELSTAACNEPYLWVNEAGERFIPESLLLKFSTICNAILSQKRVFSILTQTEVDRLMSEGCTVGWGSYILTGAKLGDLQNQLDKAIANNPEGFYYADSLDGIAKAINVDPSILRKTITDYNMMVENGEDTEFGKPKQFLHTVPVEDRYYAFELMANATNLTGGIVINPACEVIDENGKPISGLYGAGADCSGLTGFTYFSTLGGAKQSFSIYTGRTAAKSAVRYVSS